MTISITCYGSYIELYKLFALLSFPNVTYCCQEKKVNLDHFSLTSSLVIDRAIVQGNKNIFTFGFGKRI